jgi:hypothetical protein
MLASEEVEKNMLLVNGKGWVPCLAQALHAVADFSSE